MIESVDRRVIERLVYSSNASVQEAFRRDFGSDIERFVDEFAGAYERYRQMVASTPENMRSAWGQAFVYAALNSLVVSTHLLVSGYMIQSGNAMRQFAEAMAMALLCAHPRIDVFRRFEQDPMSFPTHKAILTVKKERNRKLLDLSGEGWATLEEITGFYDQYSHVSALGIASLSMLETPGEVVLGSEYDPAKKEMYAIELSRRTTAIEPFVGVIFRVEELLKEN